MEYHKRDLPVVVLKMDHFLCCLRSCYKPRPNLFFTTITRENIYLCTRVCKLAKIRFEISIQIFRSSTQ